MYGKSEVMTYEQAKAYVAAGRDKQSRPLANNTRIERIYTDAGSGIVTGYGIRLHDTYVVTILPGDRYILRTGGWNTVTTRDRINRFSPATVSTTGGQDRYGWAEDLVITSDQIGTTEPKVQTCRKCSGTGRAKEKCWGPRSFYLEPYDPDAPCEHGQKSSHFYRAESCWNCDSTGRRDYGSKPIYSEFVEGIVVDATGKVTTLRQLAEAIG